MAPPRKTEGQTDRSNNRELCASIKYIIIACATSKQPAYEMPETNERWRPLKSELAADFIAPIAKHAMIVLSLSLEDGDMRLLVIIPAYNEQDCIVDTIAELKQHAPQFDYVVINDGSKDDTKELCIRHNFNLLDLPVNIGLTGGFQAGMKYALRNNYDAAIQFDADGQHIPSYIQKLAMKMKQDDVDIVIGSRFVTERKPKSLRMLGSSLISFAIKATTGVALSDPTSGMRLYNRKMIECFSAKSDFGPEPDSLAYLMRKGARVAEVQVEMRDRQTGESYLTLSRSIDYMVRTFVSILFVQWFRR